MPNRRGGGAWSGVREKVPPFHLSCSDRSYIETDDGGLFKTSLLSSPVIRESVGGNFRKNWMNSENVRNAVVFSELATLAAGIRWKARLCGNSNLEQRSINPP